MYVFSDSALFQNKSRCVICESDHPSVHQYISIHTHQQYSGPGQFSKIAVSLLTHSAVALVGTQLRVCIVLWGVLYFVRIWCAVRQFRASNLDFHLAVTMGTLSLCPSLTKATAACFISGGQGFCPRLTRWAMKPSKSSMSLPGQWSIPRTT